MADMNTEPLNQRISYSEARRSDDQQEQEFVDKTLLWSMSNRFISRQRMCASLWPEVAEETSSINKQLDEVNTSILESRVEIVSCGNSNGEKALRLLTSIQVYTMIEHFELAQSSRRSLPKPKYCEFYPNGRLIKYAALKLRSR